MSPKSTKEMPFGTMLTAMVTPFKANLEIDFDQAAALAIDLVKLGNDGIVVNGTTGEAPTTAPEEKAQLVKVVREAVGDSIHVVAGVGNNDTADSVQHAKDAQKAGANGLLVVCPYYNKPPQERVVAHFQAVADATDLGVMTYDIPGRAGIQITTESLIKLAEHPRIVANKDAKADPFAAQQVMKATGLPYYSGDDGLNLALLAVGAIGFVSVTGHLVADRFQAMAAAYRAGDVEKAKQINLDMVPITTGIMTKAGGAIMVKAALDLLGRPGGGALRLPLVAASQTLRDQLKLDLRAGGFQL
ncbi:MAG: 4-hydroxy-tetrahydrodipicolinate synthase [Actinobacteria bacterium]|nr:4-hydroxy-tetrahydrodipicolinate synthase [Actinomycetota bacterium]